MSTESAVAEPPRMTITRIDQPTIVLTPQFNPEELKESGGANYAKLVVPGLSHQVKQFVHTEDVQLKFKLAWVAANLGATGQVQMKAAREFFKTNVRPRSAPGNISSAGAPRVLFVWPEFFSMVCTIESFAFSYKRMAVNGPPSQMDVDVVLEEIRDGLITADDEDDGSF